MRREGHFSEDNFPFGSDSWSFSNASQSLHTLPNTQAAQQDVEGPPPPRHWPKPTEFLLNTDSLPQGMGLTERRAYYFLSVAAESKDSRG